MTWVISTSPRGKKKEGEKKRATTRRVRANLIRALKGTKRNTFDRYLNKVVSSDFKYEKKFDRRAKRIINRCTLIEKLVFEEINFSQEM